MEKKSEDWMSPAAELRLVGIRTQGDYGCSAAASDHYRGNRPP